MLRMPLTISSLTSLKALASSTRPKGTMVVHRFVGETFGICWMHAVKRKKTLAYFENCSVQREALSARMQPVHLRVAVTHHRRTWARS